MPDRREPLTAAEWQEAIDLAEFFCYLDAARSYGLVKGGPQINMARVVELLEAGKARGIRPTLGCVERLTQKMLAEQEARALEKLPAKDPSWTNPQ